ncbi:LLM class flavin-dependent oxidoreductase [Pseudonocardia kujensis]|uniref:LLM class flavin-dependent oxidoreductase n=1 Tax=Pseudonocardia kujensis TaxID=1128675 RepID=UPI001E43E3F2|nr:LLM class flavin-dependent oxidoreductase [Pseudonocardia kujensis]MCE0765071.1 LLM class flavin-dependent oxidoreductase [Pseudonocardia kujensis]
MHNASMVDAGRQRTSAHRPESDAELREFRRQTLPLYNENALKLGVFGMNCSGGMAISTAESTLRIEWDHQLELAQLADRLGLEAYIPIARWKGAGGKINYLGENFEPMTFAAAIAASTKEIMTFATVHAPVVSPIAAAKMITTIDHISGGRAGLNVVMGWLTREFDMFGLTQRDHQARYAFGSEWLEIVDRLWNETAEFDFAGEHFTLKNAESAPKPIQPRPVVLNAGSSPTGAEWAARHADFNFASYASPEAGTKYVADIKRLAREKYERDIGVLTYAFVICRDTEAEARRDLERVVEMADVEGAANWMSALGLQSASFSEDTLKGEFARYFVAGGGAARVVGTPEQVAAQLQEMSGTGLDGVMLGFLNYKEELADFGEKVMPLLREAGLRK